MVIVFGVCAILLTVFVGLGALLAVVLRGTKSARDKSIVMDSLRLLVTGTLVEVAKLPGQLMRAFVEIIWPGAPQGNQMTPPGGQEQLPPPPVEPPQQQPPVEPAP